MMPYLYSCYRFITWFLTPFFGLFLRYRVFIEKERKERCKEKLGFYKQKRPNGTLYWIHCASVGELNSVANIILALSFNHNVLVTSGTLNSSIVFKQKFKENKRIMHAFPPLDSVLCVKRFLSHFRPSCAVFVESEIWPNLIYESSKTCPIFSLNTRISPKSLKRWMSVPSFFKWMLGRFKVIMPFSKSLTDALSGLNLSNVSYIGNLKYDFFPTPLSQEKLKAIQDLFRGKQIVLFASTHRGEEEALLETIRHLSEIDEIVPVLILRHPERRYEVFNIFTQAGIKATLRTKGGGLQGLYIADTVGEVLYFYSLAKIIFVGGSLVDTGGHNVLEPAFFSKPIITGPNYFNFQEVVDEMKAKNGIIVCQENEILQNILKLLQNNELCLELGRNANHALLENRGTTLKALEIIR